jgi:hypothetical protein
VQVGLRVCWDCNAVILSNFRTYFVIIVPAISSLFTNSSRGSDPKKDLVNKQAKWTAKVYQKKRVLRKRAKLKTPKFQEDRTTNNHKPE